MLAPLRLNWLAQPDPILKLAGQFLSGVTVYNAALAVVGTITAGVNHLTAVAIGANGHIYVAHNSGNNITVYTASRALYASINDPSLQHPIGVYVDGCRNTPS